MLRSQGCWIVAVLVQEQSHHAMQLGCSCSCLHSEVRESGTVDLADHIGRHSDLGGRTGCMLDAGLESDVHRIGSGCIRLLLHILVGLASLFRTRLVGRRAFRTDLDCSVAGLHLQMNRSGSLEGNHNRLQSASAGLETFLALATV